MAHNAIGDDDGSSSSEDRESEMTAAVAASGGGGSGNTRRYIVFDGSTDFELWRARLENELLRFHLLGYIVVKDYDGSQSFVYNNEEIPPKCPMEEVDDDDGEQPQSDARSNGSAAGSVLIKDEPVQQQPRQDGNGNLTGRKRMRGAADMRPGHLPRMKVIEERAEAMSILQRYLHPEVERAILGKNIFDSWATLCGMYGNRSVSDFYTVHRLMHSMKLGEKDESVQDFIARLELVMQQYAQIAGIQLTDPFRSMMLANALPADWAPLLNVWKAFKPYIPYLQLVEKVIFEFSSRLVLKERDLTLAQQTPTVEHDKTSQASPQAPKASSTATDGAKKDKTPAHTSSSSKPSSMKASASKSSTKVDQEKPKSYSRVDDKREEKSATSSGKGSEKQQSSSSHRDRHDDKRDDKRSDKHDSTKRAEEKSYTKNRDEHRDSKREERRENDRDGRRDYSSNRDKLPICYYCLRLGHSFRSCWFLRGDIENNSYADAHKKYSATVTTERNSYMVHRIEQYIREVRQDRDNGEYVKAAPRSYADQAALRGKSSFREEHTFSYSRNTNAGDPHEPRGSEPPKTPSRAYMPYGETLDHRAPEPPKTPSRSYSEIASMRSKSMYRESAPQPPSYMYAQPAESRLDSDVDRYKKRSRSVYGGDSELLVTTRPRDPRSRSVFRQADDSDTQDPHSRGSLRTMDLTGVRRSASPVPNNVHHVYSRDNRPY